MAKRAQRLPWVMVSENPTKTAEYLIQHAGGVQAAHDAITRAAKMLKKARGKPAIPDAVFWLLQADAIRRRDSCSDNEALGKTARLTLRDKNKMAAMVRRLRRALKGKSLEEYAQPFAHYGPGAPIFGFRGAGQ